METGKRNDTKRLLALTALAALGCGAGGIEVDETRGGGGHGYFDEVELRVAETGAGIATWTLQQGWIDASGEPLDALPAVVVSPTGSLEPLHAGGPPASLSVRMRGSDNLDIEPLDPESATGGNPCGEFSARYFPLDDATSVIAWPNVPAPDADDGPAIFAERADGEVVQLFHCDRLDIYPEQAGSAHLELLLWHVNHADQATDALTVDVLDAR
ncbi:MAG: hypothetical protein OXT09_27725 [Myxococcales bacterium]|nr:hypothetical protein [Myxococcales bacterium]